MSREDDVRTGLIILFMESSNRLPAPLTSILPVELGTLFQGDTALMEPRKHLGYMQIGTGHNRLG
jgi:hypothetical protein